MKKSKLAFVIWVTILSSFVFANISFSEEFIQVPLKDAKKICVELEIGKIYKKQVFVLKEANDKILEQNDLLSQQNVTLSKTILLRQEQLELCDEEIEKQKEIYEQKIKVAEVDKPSFFQKMSFGLGSIGIGIVIGVVAALLL